MPTFRVPHAAGGQYGCSDCQLYLVWLALLVTRTYQDACGKYPSHSRTSPRPPQQPARLRSCSALGDMDDDPKLSCGSIEEPTDVGAGPEPQVPPEGQAGTQGLRDQ